MSLDRKSREDIGSHRGRGGAPAAPGKRTRTEELSPAIPAGVPGPVVAPGGAAPGTAAPAAASPDVHTAAAHGIRGSAGPLPHLEQIQRSFGPYDASGIRAHTDPAAAEGARAMGAQAFAVGNRVGFAGAPDLHTAAHEAAHVVQQRAGVQLKGGVGETGDRYEQHADAVADLVVQGKSSASLLASFVGPATASRAGAPAVQRQPGTGGSCDNMPFPKVQNDSPNGSTCRRFDGVTTYKMVSQDRLIASGYKFWVTDGGFDKWVRVDGSSELWLQLPRLNAATSDAAIGQLRSIVAARRAQLNEIAGLYNATQSSDSYVAAAAQAEYQQRLDEFPGFDDDYALVPKLRDQVDADHRKAFEQQVQELVKLRDDWDPQSGTP
jgi:hypothetical protein